MDYKKVIFISKSDTSRGPLAAKILENYLKFTEIECDSRGMVVLFPEPMNAKMVAVAASKGIDLSKRSSIELTNNDFGKDTLVLVLDENNKQVVYDEFEDAVNVYTVTEFINETGSVNDPYGGELGDYGKFYDELDQIMSKVAGKIKYN